MLALCQVKIMPIWHELKMVETKVCGSLNPKLSCFNPRVLHIFAMTVPLELLCLRLQMHVVPTSNNAVLKATALQHFKTWLTRRNRIDMFNGFLDPWTLTAILPCTIQTSSVPPCSISIISNVRQYSSKLSSGATDVWAKAPVLTLVPRLALVSLQPLRKRCVMRCDMLSGLSFIWTRVPSDQTQMCCEPADRKPVLAQLANSA